jgi:hypothetical protein
VRDTICTWYKSDIVFHIFSKTPDIVGSLVIIRSAMRKLITLALVTTLATTVLAQQPPVTQFWGGSVVATPPALSGNTINLYAAGQLWKTTTLWNVFFRATASVDGVQAWANGMAFDYSLQLPLSPGVHVVTWTGTIAKGGEAPDVLWSYSVSVVVP